jgi:hypothetical protein
MVRDQCRRVKAVPGSEPESPPNVSPERREGLAERSRKPALSEVEGDPVFAGGTRGLVAFSVTPGRNPDVRYHSLPRPVPHKHETAGPPGFNQPVGTGGLDSYPRVQLPT